MKSLVIVAILLLCFSGSAYASPSPWKCALSGAGMKAVCQPK